MKKILIVLVVVILSITMFGCDKKESVNNPNYNIDKDEERTISVFAVYYEGSGFNRFCPEVKLELPDEWIYFEDMDSYIDKSDEVVLQIMAGGGPDIVYNLWDLQVYDLIKNDVLYDMTDFVENEEIFNKEDYATEVIDVGKIDGKQYYIPLQFYVPAIATFYDLEAIDGIQKDDYITWDKIKELGAKYTGENGTKYFLDRKINDPFSLFNGKLIDYSARKSCCANTDFLELIKMDDEYYNVIPEETWDMYGNSINIAKSEDSLFHMALFYAVTIKELMDDGYNYYIYPIQRTTEDKSIRCSVYDIIGINKSANNKEDCFEFIRFKLSSITQLTNSFYMPTNKTTYFNYLDYIQSQYEGVDIGNFITSIKNIYANLDGGYLYDDIYAAVEDGVNINDDITEDEFLNLIDKQVSDAFNKN